MRVRNEFWAKRTRACDVRAAQKSVATHTTEKYYESKFAWNEVAKDFNNKFQNYDSRIHEIFYQSIRLFLTKKTQ